MTLLAIIGDKGEDISALLNGGNTQEVKEDLKCYSSEGEEAVKVDISEAGRRKFFY